MPPIFSDEKKKQLREQMISCGFLLIKQQGIKKTSIDEIVMRVGIAKGTFYHFFPTKQEFILQIIREYQYKKLAEFENQTADGKMIGVNELIVWYKSFASSDENPLLYITQEDGQWLRAMLPKEAILDEKNDIAVAKMLLSRVHGVRHDIDYSVVANFPKLIFLMFEHHEELHKASINQTMELIFNMMMRYLKEEES